MVAPCNCGGGSSAAASGGSGGGSGFQIQLRNGSFVGRFGTAQQAQHALNTTFKGAGTVVPR